MATNALTKTSSARASLKPQRIIKMPKLTNLSLDNRKGLIRQDSEESSPKAKNQAEFNYDVDFNILPTQPS